jgi:hypothetical protein
MSLNDKAAFLWDNDLVYRIISTEIVTPHFLSYQYLHRSDFEHFL